APTVITSPIPSATVESRSARVSARFGFRTIQPVASVLRIVYLSKFLKRLPGKQHSACGRISRDQGAFAAGTPRKESYNRAATPATIATSARLNPYQLKVFPPI